MSYRIAAVRTLGVVAIVAMAYLAGTGGATADNAPYSGVTTAIGGQAGLFAVNTAVPTPAAGVTPVATADNFSVAPGTTLTANVLLNDTNADVARPSGAWNGPTPISFSLTGALTYAAPAGSSGSYTFSYVAYNGTISSNTVTTVTITIETATSGAGTVATAVLPATYASSCAGCHAADGSGGFGPALLGSTLSNPAFLTIVQDGVAGTAMPGYATTLSAADIQAITDFFVPPPVTPGTTVPPSTTVPSTTVPSTTVPSTTVPAGGPDGAALYAASCSGCHGSGGAGGFGPALSPTSLSNAAFVTITRDGIAGSAMPSYQTSLTAIEIQAIADHFVSPATGGGTTPTTTPPTTPPTTTPAVPGTGASVYNAFCAQCHGSDLTGTPMGPGVIGESRSEIAKVVRQGDGTMPAFSSAMISDKSLAMLSDYMATFGSKGGHDDDDESDDDHGTTTTTAPAAIGSSVYTSYCAACHGADGTGTNLGPDIVGESRSETLDVVRSGDDGMPAFSATMLSDADLQAVADYVAALGGGSDGHGDKKSDDHDDDEKKSKDHDEDDD